MPWAGASTFVLGGDIFDFRWSTLPSLEHTVDAALHWLDELAASQSAAASSTSCWATTITTASSWRCSIDSPAEPTIYEWHRTHLQLRHSLFLHGDIADKPQLCHRNSFCGGRSMGGRSAPRATGQARSTIGRFMLGCIIWPNWSIGIAASRPVAAVCRADRSRRRKRLEARLLRTHPSRHVELSARRHHVPQPNASTCRGSSLTHCAGGKRQRSDWFWRTCLLSIALLFLDSASSWAAASTGSSQPLQEDRRRGLDMHPAGHCSMRSQGRPCQWL